MVSTDQRISFDQMPEMVSELKAEIQDLKALVLQLVGQPKDTDRWFNLQELRDYIPEHPAQSTIYRWIGEHAIPYHKRGRKLSFSQKEIDAWLQTGRHKTDAEMSEEAVTFINHRREGRL